MTTHTQLVLKISDRVQKLFASEEGSHDWWHIHRVWSLALKIADQEKANLEIVSLGALLHDIADHKYHNGDITVGPKKAETMLREEGADETCIRKVVDIVNEVTFKGAAVETPVTSIEAACVQDADRLDAIGAIGIARAFAYGGSNNRLLHDPNTTFRQHASFDEYKNDKGATTHHFYEKLLLIKDRMQTQTGKSLALHRHEVMVNYLEQFFAEWEGSR